MTRSGRQRVVAALALVSAVLLGRSPAVAQRAPLTIERMVAAPSLLGTTPSHPVWSPNSEWLAFLWNERALPERDLWLVKRNGSTPRRLTQLADAAAGRGSVSDFCWAPDGRTIVFIFANDLWRVSLSDGVAIRLTTDGGDKSEVAASPNGRFVSFLRDGDLWLLPNGESTPVRATRVGVPPIGTVPLGTYYRRDVEIGHATWGSDAPAYAWSPDSRFVAVHYVDRRSVRTVGIPYYLGAEPTLNLLRRGYPGDSNEVRTLGFVDVSSNGLWLLDLPDKSATRIVDFSWSPTGELLIDRESDDAIDRTLLLATPMGGAPRQIWTDHRESRVYTDIASAWSEDGRRVLLTGDLDDRYRLYLLTPGNTEPRPLTKGPFDVIGRAIAAPTTHKVFYVSSEPNPAERHVFRMDANGKGARRLTTKPGAHLPFVSPDGQTVALLSSDDVTPTELYLLDVRPGASERRITHSPPPEFARYPWVKARYVTFRSRTDSLTLHARILEPPNVDRTKTYPVLFGPVYSNTVRNRWAGLNSTLQQYLVLERGYIVVQVDVRGSTGYGRDFREKFLMDWGGGDLDDLESAVDYMTSLPYVDPRRIGIWGSSYGGTLTVYSLFKKPGLFAAGVAAAPATDPHFFGSDDVAIVRRPSTHPDAFARGALPLAGNLRDHLLIIHGMEDDVVPFKTSVALAEELMRLGKDFDFAFAPAATHGWTQRPYVATYLLRKLVDHFDRYLGPQARAEVPK